SRKLVCYPRGLRAFRPQYPLCGMLGAVSMAEASMDNAPSGDADLDEIIGAIYDCVIDPSRWHDVVDAIRRRYDFYNAILGVNSATSNEIIMSVSVGIPEDMMAVVQTHGHDVLELWGGWSRLAATPLEEPMIQSQA